MSFENKIIDMMNTNTQHSENMNARLEALMQVKKMIDAGDIEAPERTNFVNNHIHTTFSFSPYSPTMAVYKAYMSGLSTAGIMDHDSISGAKEFIKAGKIMNMPTTVGLEFRVSTANTPLSGRRTNNTDQVNCTYIAVHGIPHTQFQKINSFISPYKQHRHTRNRQMIAKMNKVLSKHGMALDYDINVLPLSQYIFQGGVTERHLLFALANKLIKKFGQTSELVDFLRSVLNLSISGNVEKLLLDKENGLILYDLLNALKTDLTWFYIEAFEELPKISEFAKFIKTTGAVLAYPYLGDVENSVTGDKRPQKFEDSYLEELFDYIDSLKFDALAYMPARNTQEQLNRVRKMCDEYQLLQISGEDINQPRQPFVSEMSKQPQFSNLIDATWALIGHEYMATEKLEDAMFSDKTKEKYPDLQERIQVYKQIGMSLRG